MLNASCLSRATLRKVRVRLLVSSLRRTDSMDKSIFPASIFDRSRMSLIRRSRLVPAEWITSADSTSSADRF